MDFDAMNLDVAPIRITICVCGLPTGWVVLSEVIPEDPLLPFSKSDCVGCHLCPSCVSKMDPNLLHSMRIGSDRQFQTNLKYSAAAG